MLSQETRLKMRADAEAATPGPVIAGIAPDEPDTCLIGTNGIFWARVIGTPERKAMPDARLFAYARQMTLALLDHADDMDRENASLRADLRQSAERIAAQAELLGRKAEVSTEASDNITNDNRYCGHCHDFTDQECRDSDHERDSSADWRKCLTCGWEYRGLTGAWHPPYTEPA